MLITGEHLVVWGVEFALMIDEAVKNKESDKGGRSVTRVLFVNGSAVANHSAISVKVMKKRIN